MNDIPPIRICFVAHFAHGAMAGGDSGHIGGVERQTSLMARWFAARRHQVSMLTWDEEQEDDENLYTVAAIYLWTLYAKAPQNFFLLIV